ncbi:hypothetical protein V6Z11_D10G097000 [Gossypium hirsutum]
METLPRLVSLPSLSPSLAKIKKDKKTISNGERKRSWSKSRNYNILYRVLSVQLRNLDRVGISSTLSTSFGYFVTNTFELWHV